MITKSTQNLIMTTTKRWKVTLVLELEEGSHPRKFIPDTINDSLNHDKDEDILQYDFKLLDD